MANEEHLRILGQGVAAWNQWCKSNLEREPNFSDAKFQGLDLTGANLFNARLNGADLSGAILEEALLMRADLSAADLSHAKLAKANLQQALLIDATVHPDQIRSAALWQLAAYDEVLGDALGIPNNTRDRVQRRDFQDVNLKRADLDGASLVGADFRRAALQGTSLRRADLYGADLRGALVNDDTKFAGATVEGCAIDRFTLECLGRGYGGLTNGQRMTMRIYDGVATLRATYSGFWQWVHITALVTFLFPYIWFVVWNWTTRASFAPAEVENRITLWKALFRYIWNGGIQWQIGWQLHWSFFIFLLALAYNVLRFLLLYKTKQLELQQESSGVPAMFSLEGSWWGSAFRAANVILWINFGVVILNTFHFMTQTIPLE